MQPTAGNSQKNRQPLVASLAAHAQEEPSCRVTSVEPDTPKTAFPPQLERATFESQLREYIDFFRPVGPVENMLVRQLTRQSVAMEVWDEGVAALQTFSIGIGSSGDT